MKISIRIVITCILLTLPLLGMIGRKQWTLETGVPVLLETQPVDPRSLFRGDYVRLNYTVSDLDLDVLSGDDEFLQYDDVYVVLEKGEHYWEAAAVFHQRPESASQEVILRGKIKYVQTSRWNPETKKSESAKRINVRYGIENYFVPEGAGHELERPPAGSKVEMVIAVDRFGQAGIKAVLIDGKERYREKLF
jgi:uncharacterized membrane-anchored protein